MSDLLLEGERKEGKIRPEGRENEKEKGETEEGWVERENRCLRCYYILLQNQSIADDENSKSS